MIFAFLFAIFLGTTPTRVSGIARNQESWSSECLPIVRAAHRATGEVVAPVVVKRNEAVTPELFREFNLKCAGLLPIFELVVDRNGDVRCVRIIHLGDTKPSPKLSRLVHQQVQTWKFKPATVLGQTVDVLFNVTISYRCN
jgi:hypothetical protein